MNREGAGLLALGALLVLDVVLVAAALQSVGTSDQPSRVSAQASGAAQPGSGRSAPPSTSTTTSAAPRPPVAAAPLNVGIVAVDDRVAWRFTTSTCDEGESTLSLTRDGGRTWQLRVAPFDATTRVRVRPNGTAFAVGGNRSADCVPAVRQSTGAAENWGTPARASGFWYRDPRDATVVGTPAGRSAKPCGASTVIDLGIADAGAAALCDGGRILASTDGGAWEQTATAEQAVAVAVRQSGQIVLAMTDVDGCGGVAVADAHDPQRVLGCAVADLRGVEGGDISLSVTTDAGWLLIGDQTFRSSTALTDWRPS